MFILRVITILLGIWLCLMLLGFLARFWIKRKLKLWQKTFTKPFAPEEPPSPLQPRPLQNAQDMVRCEQCGTFLADAVEKGGKYYCREHT
jgi:hypothetical protein